ncbi:MAG TPA: flagellin [Burkholderiales bacterium]|nr:flagellin [Burkholderiales bacterium]
MPQIINTNIASLVAQNNLNASQSQLNTALQRLSSGLRINSAKDDAAGYAIVQGFTAQINGLNQAAQNANDGISLAQTAGGGLSTISDLLQRIRELAVQSANGTNSSADRQALQAEVAQDETEINRIANTTQFNGLNLLDGSLSSTQFQVGANANQTISFGIGDVRGSSIGDYGLSTAAAAGTSVEATAAAAAAANNRVAAQTLTVAGGGTSKTVAVAAGDSAQKIAANINAVSASTGVTADAATYATLGSLGAAGTVTFNLYGSNSSPASISATIGSTTDLSSLAQAINAQSATTGITAAASGGTVQLTSTDGYDIKIENFSNSAGASGTINLTGADSSFTAVGSAATLGAAASTDSSTVGGRVTFSSPAGYTVTTNTANTLFAATTPNAGTLSAVSSIDISTVGGANSAISVIDSALQTVNTLGAQLGAIQNRFSSTISSLQTTQQNLTSARSGVQDADFASETANLTRAEILQQAGVAVLAQANALPNNVLALLKG